MHSLKYIARPGCSLHIIGGCEHPCMVRNKEKTLYTYLVGVVNLSLFRIIVGEVHRIVTSRLWYTRCCTCDRKNVIIKVARLWRMSESWHCIEMFNALAMAAPLKPPPNFSYLKIEKNSSKQAGAGQVLV